MHTSMAIFIHLITKKHFQYGWPQVILFTAPFSWGNLRGNSINWIQLCSVPMSDWSQSLFQILQLKSMSFWHLSELLTSPSQSHLILNSLNRQSSLPVKMYRQYAVPQFWSNHWLFLMHVTWMIIPLIVQFWMLEAASHPYFS